jgi:hypothetical protein
MNKIESIIVFGTESCKFCSIQLQRLRDSFPKNKIAYVDLIKDDEAIDLAKELNLEYTPSTIVLGDSNIIAKKTGLVAVDELFYEINKTIPVDLDILEKLNNKENCFVLMSFNPITEKNKGIKIETYNQDLSASVKINSIKKIGSSEIINMFGEKVFKRYKTRTGKSNAFLLDLKRGE